MQKETNKLHQLLAVENDRKTQAINIIDETVETLSKKHDHFDGLTKIYEPYDENEQKIPPESKEIVTTVKEKINYSKQAISKGIDAQISKEETNASGSASAELVLPGEVSFGYLSATALLALEQHLVRIRNMYKVIPTLDPTKKWLVNDAGVFETDPEVKYRTEKKVEKIVKYEATKEHPAQVDLVTLDKQVGEYKTTYKSGKITPYQKSILLERIDKAIDAVKSARAVANSCEVKNVYVGEKLFQYINSGIL
jgi:hypothetical protein